MDVVVIGAGPAGLAAAFRAAELGARTVLVTRGEVGGMAANDGPIPVRTLAQAARLLREARQLGKYGIQNRSHLAGRKVVNRREHRAKTRKLRRNTHGVNRFGMKGDYVSGGRAHLLKSSLVRIFVRE